jgi:hypothetical protein
MIFSFLKVILDFILYLIFRIFLVFIVIGGCFLIFKYFSNVFDYKVGKDVSRKIQINLEKSEKQNANNLSKIKSKIKSAPFKYIIDHGYKWI